MADGGQSYASTRWSLLLDRGGDARACWDHFYQRYRRAVAALYLRKGVPHAEVDDLVHEFFAHAFEHDFLVAADPERGRFRGYLRVAAERFLVSAWRKAGRQKRRPEGGVGKLQGDELVEDRRALTPEEAFDAAWARSVLVAAMSTVREQLEARCKGPQLEAFELRTSTGASWEEVGARCGTTPEAARKWVARVKERVGAAIRAEVMDTVSSAAELDAELGALAALLGGGHR